MMVVDGDMRAALDIFVTESRELLQDMEDNLLGLEDDANPDTVNAVFRAAHTIKGSSGLFGLDHVVSFMHAVETVLGQVREGRTAVTHDLVSILLPCTDHVSRMLDGIAEGRAEVDDGTGAHLLARLAPYLPGAVDGPHASGAAPEVPAEVVRLWQLSLRFGPDSFRNGMDPLAFLRYLTTLGTVTEVEVVTDALPDAADFDPETCYLAFEIGLRSAAPKGEIDAVFDFVREDGDIRIQPGDVDALVQLINAMPSSDRLGELLVRSGAVTEAEMETALRIQEESAAPDGTQPPLGEILVDRGIAPWAVVDAALGKQRKISESRPPDTQTLRVDSARLDKLIDLVGELVIAQAASAARTTGESAANQEIQAEVMRLVEEVRHSALSLRMVPIGTTLRRFERVVRDVSTELGKEAHLLVTGGDTEMDKALVERIGDPLLHLVRNSLDHGLESPEERRQAGKPARGTVRLNAFHDAGCIVIEVSDDGRGLDRDRILAKATERGLVESGTSMNNQDVYDLIFEPGFSTAASVSNLSGRGVGMDVVRRNVSAIRGTIEVETQLGVGTTIRIRLPLTLAIIDGFLVGVGRSSFIVPLDRVTECVELPPVDTNRDCMNLRGEVLPFIRLRSMFGIADPPPRRQSVVVVEQSGQRTGLVVDALLGQFQTVIKPLGALFSNAKCISGSTVLGNGDIALILDVGPLVGTYVESTR